MKIKNILIFGMAFCCLLLVNKKAEAQSIVKDVKITPEETKVQFADEVAKSYLLEIGGPGQYYRKQNLEKAQNIHLTTLDEKGEVLPDGVYKMQITPIFLLTAEQRLELSSLRAEGNAQKIADFRKENNLPESVDVFAINFSIRNGQFVSPEQKEGKLNLPSSSSTWERNHLSLYASLNVVELNYQPRTMDSSPMNDDDDQVIADDLIVQGSICVGFDCVNGESFGFDTIKLKENNVRIKFEDTSNTASFPSRDWQITANDSSNGGANKFSIDDIDGGRTPFTIEAGAPSHSLYVDDGGRVGFGTSTPVAALHSKDGNTPTLRLEQDGSSGFTPQTWDVASNEANFFIRDATNGSTLPFRIRPGAPTSSIDILANGQLQFLPYVASTFEATPAYFLGTDADGKVLKTPYFSSGGGSGGTSPWLTSGSNIYYNTGSVGIGVVPTVPLDVVGNVKITSGRLGIGVAPTVPLDVVGNVKITGNTLSTGNTVIMGNFSNIMSSGATFFGAGNSIALKIDAATGRVGIGKNPGYQLELSTDSAAKPGGGSWTAASDRRLKKDIIDFTAGLETVLNIRPVKYHYNGKLDMPMDKEFIGVIAQEMQEIAPYTISKLATKSTENYLAFDATAVPYMLVNAIKEQQQQIESLQKEIARLQNDLSQLSELKQAVSELTQLVKVQQSDAASATARTVSSTGANE